MSPLLSARAATRNELLQQLSAALHTDPRLAGLILVGSGANGFRDDDSDLDLVAPIAESADEAAVFRDWKERIDTLIPVRYHAKTAFTEQHHLLVLLCPGLLEVDLSFPALAALAPVTPRWRVLWERTGAVTQRMSMPAGGASVAPEQEYLWLLNRALHRVVYAAKALRRGQVWKALLLVDELRVRTLQLACLHYLGDAYGNLLSEDGVERHVDELPATLLAAFARSLPLGADGESLRASLMAAVELLLTAAATLDLRFGVDYSRKLAPLLKEHLE